MEFSSSVSVYGDQDLAIVERDPSGRYVRHDEILGEGALKKVYRAFDEENGNEVAWSKVGISDGILNSEKQLRSLHAVADLLKSLKHENVVRCHHSWVDDKNKTFNMITELVTSGNLRDYRCKHKGIFDYKAIKKWAKQILSGLNYLHSQDPPILHRHLTNENVFVNGYSGKVKIGGIGLANVLQNACISEPEFMAPELYNQDYNHLVDIYSFGMCMLQMVTREFPYSECNNSDQVLEKVNLGIKPNAFDKVVDPHVREFIDKCIAPVSERYSAKDLLNDPFLVSSDSSPTISNPHCPTEAGKVAGTERTKKFKLQGEMKEKNSISMSLRYTNSVGVGEKAKFVFSLDNDTVSLVVEEMIEDLKFTPEDAVLITQLMEKLITELVPGFGSCLDKSKCSSHMSSLTEEDLSLHSFPTTEFVGDVEDCDDKERISDLADYSSDYRNASFSQVQKVEAPAKRKCLKEMALKPLSSCLKKLLFNCWKAL